MIEKAIEVLWKEGRALWVAACPVPALAAAFGVCALVLERFFLAASGCKPHHWLKKLGMQMQAAKPIPGLAALLRRFSYSQVFQLCLIGLSMGVSPFAWAAAQSESKTPGQAQAAAPNSLAEELKAFVAAPHGFCEMLAEVSKPVPGATNERRFSYFVLLRSQENAFFYREAPSLLDLATTNCFPTYRLAGFYGQGYWNLSADARTLTSSTNDGTAMRATMGYVLGKASIITHLGIYDTLPGSLAWDDNKIVPFINSAGVRLGGRLRVLRDSPPSGLDLSTDYKGSRIPWEIAYEYREGGSLPRFLPEKITGWSLSSAGARYLNFEVRLLAARFKDELQSAEYFAPAAFLSPAMHEVISTSAGNFFFSKGSKQWQALPADPGESAAPKAQVVRLIFLVIIVSGFAALYASWRRAAHRKAN